MLTTVCFDDVLLVPRYSDITSRKEISLDRNLDPDICLKFPVIQRWQYL